MTLRSQAQTRRLMVQAAISVGLVALAVLLALFGAIMYLLRAAPGDPNGSPVVVRIERGWGLSRIAKQLEQAGVIADRTGFSLLAHYRYLDSRLKAGEYAIARGQSPAAVLDMLVHHRTLKRRFTVVPGSFARQIVVNLDKAGMDPSGQAERAIVDPNFAAELGVPTTSLEGYLYPETYFYEKVADDARTLLARMVKQFFVVWNQRFAARARESTLTPLQIVTLASIIEKESGYSPERPQIARVFLNRLAQGMRLQADPTVIYVLIHQRDPTYTYIHKVDHALAINDLRISNPYNTYAHGGLPPGPICSPSADAIAAVLWPADGSWLYFVADGNGRHVFSTTLEEHHRAVQRYQR